MSILGIGAGKIELQLNGTDFHPCDTIEGTANIILNNEVKARGVTAELIASRTEQRYDTFSRRSRSQTIVLHHEEQSLDSEKLYKAGTPMRYTFKFIVPKGILNDSMVKEGLVGGAMGFFRDMGNKAINWEVKVKLDVPMAFDVSKSRQIRVRLGPQTGTVIQ